MIKRPCRKCQRRKPLDAFPVKATPGPALVCNRCLGLPEHRASTERAKKRPRRSVNRFDRAERRALIAKLATSARCTECHALAMPNETLCCDCQAQVAGVA